MNERSSRILVVDDNPKNLDVLSDLLDQQDFTVLFALDGSTGIQRALSGQPDLILLDVMMPGIDGFETCRRLKVTEEVQDIPVIFMTALTETLDKVKGFECGAVDYITKPIEPEEVLARITTHLTIQRLQRDLKQKNAMLADREAHLEHLVKKQTQELEEKALKIENITMTLINALENANALHDDDTGKHIKRIGAYSAFLAEKYGCSDDFVKRIRIYASLHDVGKIGLPDNILKKPGMYTQEEFLLMQKHVEFGASLLDNEQIDRMAYNIALYHHEKWDGTGYVQQLQGEDIPLEARIAALADVYDALTTKRVYKEAFSEKQAEQIIQAERGKHFDPALVDIFFAHIDGILAIKTSFA